VNESSLAAVHQLDWLDVAHCLIEGKVPDAWVDKAFDATCLGLGTAMDIEPISEKRNGSAATQAHSIQ